MLFVPSAKPHAWEVMRMRMCSKRMIHHVDKGVFRERKRVVRKKKRTRYKRRKTNEAVARVDHMVDDGV